jgi:putative Mg2+ transporter-C (MgtC) family protein
LGDEEMLSDSQIILRLVLAALLSGLIGFEREIHGRAAGFRTHILVSVGATLLTMTSIYIAEIYQGIAQADPSRIAAQIVTGVGFLGAGTILRFRASIRGLTTAASLWTVAGVGLAIGCGFYQGAMVTTVIVLVALLFFSYLERKMVRKDWYKTLSVRAITGFEVLTEIRKVLSDYRVEIRDLEITKPEEGEILNLEMDLKLLTVRHDDQIISDIMRIKGVKGAGWK